MTDGVRRLFPFGASACARLSCVRREGLHGKAVSGYHSVDVHSSIVPARRSLSRRGVVKPAATRRHVNPLVAFIAHRGYRKVSTILMHEKTSIRTPSSTTGSNRLSAQATEKEVVSARKHGIASAGRLTCLLENISCQKKTRWPRKRSCATVVLPNLPALPGRLEATEGS